MISVSGTQVRLFDDQTWSKTRDWVLEEIGPPRANDQRALIDESVVKARQSGFKLRADVLGLVRYVLTHGMVTHSILSDERLSPAKRLVALRKYPPVKVPV